MDTDEPSNIKAIDYPGCHMREVNERNKKRLSIYAQPDFIKDYLDGELYLGLRFVSGKFKQHGFVFQIAEVTDMELNASAKYGKAVDRKYCRDQSFMLSQNVELMEGPQQVVTSVVWPERFNDFDVGWREPLFVFYSIKRIDEVVEGSENGKVMLAIRYYASPQRESGTEQVQGTPKRPDDYSDLRMDDVGQRLFDAHYRELLIGLRIRVYRNYLEAIGLPRSDTTGENWELGFAPCDCGSRI